MSQLDNLRVCAVMLSKEMQLYMLWSTLHFWKIGPRYIKEIRDLVHRLWFRQNWIIKLQTMVFKVPCLHIHLLSKVGFLLLEEPSQCFGDTVIPIYLINQLLDSCIKRTSGFPWTKKIQTHVFLTSAPSTTVLVVRNKVIIFSKVYQYIERKEDL